MISYSRKKSAFYESVKRNGSGGQAGTGSELHVSVRTAVLADKGTNTFVK